MDEIGHPHDKLRRVDGALSIHHQATMVDEKNVSCAP
jgi:hypothetical protein